MYSIFYFIVVNLRSVCLFVSESEDFGSVGPIDLKLKELPKSNWDDEDVDENDIKESWEDEDEPAQVWTIKNNVTVGHFIYMYTLTYSLIIFKKRWP